MKIEPMENIGGTASDGDYLKRQLHWMGNLGLFYIILIALFAVPLMGTFVVILIKGAIDFQYLILGGGILAASLMIFFTAKFGFRLFSKIKNDGLFAVREAGMHVRRGEAFRIDLFGGFLTFSCGGKPPDIPAIGADMSGAPPSLPPPPGEKPSRITDDPVRKLRELSDLKEEGLIDNAEFFRLKGKIIRDACPEPQPSEPTGNHD